MSKNLYFLFSPDQLSAYCGYYEIFVNRVPGEEGPALMAVRLFGFFEDGQTSPLEEEFWLCSTDARFKPVNLAQKEVLRTLDFLWLVDYFRQDEAMRENGKWQVRLRAGGDGQPILAPERLAPTFCMDLVEDPSEELRQNAVITACTYTEL